MDNPGILELDPNDTTIIMELVAICSAIGTLDKTWSQLRVIRLGALSTKCELIIYGILEWGMIRSYRRGQYKLPHVSMDYFCMGAMMLCGYGSCVRAVDSMSNRYGSAVYPAAWRGVEERHSGLWIPIAEELQMGEITIWGWRPSLNLKNRSEYVIFLQWHPPCWCSYYCGKIRSNLTLLEYLTLLSNDRSVISCVIIHLSSDKILNMRMDPA